MKPGVVLDKLPSHCQVRGETTSSYIELVAFEADNKPEACGPNNQI